MVGEAIAGLGALKTAFDIAKGLKDIDDRTRLNGAVIELQEKILSGQQAQSELLNKVGTLEKEVADLKAWDAEKQKYELKNVGAGSMAYMLKPDARGTEPPHWLCPNCYAQGKKAFFQPMGGMAGGRHTFRCGACQGMMATHAFNPTWI